MKIDLLGFLDDSNVNIVTGLNLTRNPPFFISIIDETLFDKYYPLIRKYIKLEGNKGYSKLLESVTKRHIKTRIINSIELDNNNLLISYNTNSYITISFDNYINIQNIINIVSDKMNNDYMKIYKEIRNNIDNVYIYDSYELALIDYQENDKDKLNCSENNLYIFYNSNNELFDNQKLIRAVISDFINLYRSDNYFSDKDKTILTFENNKSINIYGNTILKNKDLIDIFQDKLIKNKICQQKIKRKVINNEKFNNGKIS